MSEREFREYDSNGDPRSDYRERRPVPVIRQRGDCWVCDGTGRVMRSGVTKLIPCGECSGTGWLDGIA